MRSRGGMVFGRGGFLALALALALALGLASHAGAEARVSLLWTGTTGDGLLGGPVIAAQPGDQLTATLWLSPDAAGTSSYSVSVRFDPDFGDELELVAVNELLPAGFAFHIAAGTSRSESNASQAGEVQSFDAATFGSGPTSGSYAIGELVFEVTAQLDDDDLADVVPGFFHAGVDGMFDNTQPFGAPVPVRFETASVIAHPDCGNGLDDDLDGRSDYPGDPGCRDPNDPEEQAYFLVCDDGRDNDGDALFDYPRDPGCASSVSPRENPACNDGLDNDGDGDIDWNGGPGGRRRDSYCVGRPWNSQEQAGRRCGLGFELALALLLARFARPRRAPRP